MSWFPWLPGIRGCQTITLYINKVCYSNMLCWHNVIKVYCHNVYWHNVICCILSRCILTQCCDIVLSQSQCLVNGVVKISDPGTVDFNQNPNLEMPFPCPICKKFSSAWKTDPQHIICVEQYSLKLKREAEAEQLRLVERSKVFNAELWNLVRILKYYFYSEFSSFFNILISN